MQCMGVHCKGSVFKKCYVGSGFNGGEKQGIALNVEHCLISTG